MKSFAVGIGSVPRFYGVSRGDTGASPSKAQCPCPRELVVQMAGTDDWQEE